MGGGLKYGHSRAWTQDTIRHYSPTIQTRNPRAVTVAIDATYFGKRRDKLGLIVAKDIALKEPIAYNFIETETKEVYRDLLAQIQEKGFVINAVVLDGKPGTISLFYTHHLHLLQFQYTVSMIMVSNSYMKVSIICNGS